MTKFIEKLNRITDNLAPMCLFSSAFFYIILWYLNLNVDDVLRRQISIILSVVFLCLSLIKFFSVYYYYPYRRKAMAQLIIIPAVWMSTFIIAILQNGMNPLIVSIGGVFIIYGLPIFIFTVVTIMESNEKYFVEKFKWFAVILSPAMGYYIFRILVSESFSSSRIFLGKLTYMDIAYMLLPIIIFCVFDFWLNVNNKEYRYNKLIIAIIGLFTTALMFTGTKGTIICWSVFLFCFILYYIFIMKDKNTKVRNLIAFMLINTLLFGVIWIPPASGMKRIEVFSQQIAEDYNNDTYQIADKKQFEDLDEKKIKLRKMLKNQSSTERLVLYELAILEARSNPLFGMGSMGYNLKYGKGLYPHNIFLEMFADWGYPIGIAFILFVFIVFRKLYLMGKNDLIIICLVIYFISVFPKSMLSGSIYNNGDLLMLITYYFSKKFIKSC